MLPNDCALARLDAELLAAHDAGDRGALIKLYAQAASLASSGEARGFYLTQAYIFALEAGHPNAQKLKSELVALGRDR